MAEMILHHYSLSTFSEKVRVALGLKGLADRSVDIPPAPPRPRLAPLTGGYRRVPVLQVGADIFCDTNITLPALYRAYASRADAVSGRLRRHCARPRLRMGAANVDTDDRRARALSG